MDLFSRMSAEGYEQMVWSCDPFSGLRSVIAIHSTVLGPALGGTRMWPYQSEQQAVEDCLRLARAMTYKAAIAGLFLGGGKGVIIGDPGRDKNEELMRSYGRVIAGLAGRYITAEDVGTEEKDMDFISLETPFVTGTTPYGLEGGDPSAATAYGVFLGINKCVGLALKKESIKGVAVAVQGLGHVGMNLCRLLYEAGAQLTVSDIDEKKVTAAERDYGARGVGVDEIVGLDVDVLAPCALGAVVNSRTVSNLSCAIVAGAANNVLETLEAGRLLQKRGILYAPDYVINAGGLIHVADQLQKFNRQRVRQRIEAHAETLAKVLVRARDEGISTQEEADRLVEERLNKARFLGWPRQRYTPPGGQC